MSENNSKFENQISWLDADIPLSTRFNDPYFSKSDGLQETRHVFINANQLPVRWPNLEICTIGELGFGTGLNFLVTALEWQKSAKSHQQLHFISFEQYPISSEDMLRALSQWSELEDASSNLAIQWNEALISNGNIIKIKWSNQISLTVILGDANTCLNKQEMEVDAWYLDGFSPAKNPELWNIDLMQCVYDKTLHGGTFATYTAAGWVRRNLTEVGYKVERILGHAGKRQMSIGQK